MSGQNNYEGVPTRSVEAVRNDSSTDYELQNLDSNGGHGQGVSPSVSNIYPRMDGAGQPQGRSNSAYVRDTATEEGPNPERHVSVVDVGDAPRRDDAGASHVNVNMPDEETDDNKDNIELLRSEDMNRKEPFDAGLYFEDGHRRVDFVIAYQQDEDSAEEAKKQRWREEYQKNLQKEGLEIEIASKEYDKDEKIYFIKLHASWEVLTRYAEVMNMKMALAENDMVAPDSLLEKIAKPFHYDEDILPELKDNFTAAFTRARESQFIIESRETFFTPAQRGLITDMIMTRAVFEDVGDQTRNKFGIKKLLSLGAYTAAYPLHEGDSTFEGVTPGTESYRHLLYETWARPKVWYKFQPLDHIRHYFGEKIAIYFTWLGYYTGLLIPAALVGLIVFLYGCFSLSSNKISEEICDDANVNSTGNTVMCPLCDNRCTYWNLKESCLNAKVTYLFDNNATVFFAAFMALWATFFHEMWKRKEAEIQYDWDVADFEEEETVRPEFEATVRQRRVNPVNKTEEPFLNSTSKLCRACSSVWVVVFMLCIVVAAVFGVIVYRMTVSAALYAVSDTNIKSRATTITSITAACINLIAIIILGKVYQIIAKFLTDFETHRTLTEWEDSFTLKMFLFQFVNHNASLFYIALIKGKSVGRPGDYNRDIGGARQEECGPAGCLIELCIQLAIIMVGKQAFNNFKEFVLPKVMNWFKARQMQDGDGKENETVARWEKDYIMQSMPELGLFDEYLEMVIQYGFVTIFVAAFPLAPLFALLNNIIEVRLDAYKYVTQLRRPLAMRAQDIGIWFGILQGISQIAVISNAFIIAFTAEFIPRLVYRYGYEGEDNRYNNIVKFTMSEFKTADFTAKGKPDVGNATTCWYRGYYTGPTDIQPYQHSIAHWHVVAARLAFVIVFIFAVQALSWLIAYLVPDVPRTVKLQILREKYLAKEALMASDHLKVNKKDK